MEKESGNNARAWFFPPQFLFGAIVASTTSDRISIDKEQIALHPNCNRFQGTLAQEKEERLIYPLRSIETDIARKGKQTSMQFVSEQ